MCEIFCCGSEGNCESYKRGEIVNFKYIRSPQGMVELKDEAFPLRWIFLLSGELIFTRGEEERMVLKQGEMCLLPSMVYTMMVAAEAEWIYFVSDRPTEYCLNAVVEMTAELKRKEYCLEKITVLPLLNQFLDLLKLYLDSGINCERLFEEKQEELFMLLLSIYPHQELGQFLYSLTLHQHNDLRKFIEENCCRAKNVTELAAICGYSVSGFKRIFKQMFDEPVYRWMQQQKAERLRKMLEEEEVNLKMLCSELDFSSPAHFTKFCKQWLGMTPTQYMEEVRHRQNLLNL